MSHGSFRAGSSRFRFIMYNLDCCGLNIKNLVYYTHILGAPFGPLVSTYTIWEYMDWVYYYYL